MLYLSILGNIGKYYTEFFSQKHGTSLYFWIFGGLAASILILALLHMMPNRMRKKLIIIATFLGGLFFVLEFVLPGNAGGDNVLTPWTESLGIGITVLGAFTWGLGIINLATAHGKTLFRLKQGWYNSLAFFFGFFAMVIFSFWKMSLENGSQGIIKNIVDNSQNVLFNGFFAPLGASVFALLAFYIVSAAYRAFRIRSADASVMMISAFLVMIGQVTIGQHLTHTLPQAGFWSAFRTENISEWIMSNINMAAQRGIGFGVAVGALAMSLRIWLSLEKGDYFESEL